MVAPVEISVNGGARVTPGAPMPVAQRTMAKLVPGMPTFYAQSAGYLAYATPTDLCAVRNPVGSGKLIVPRNMSLNIGSTAAALMKFYWYRRNAFNTGGTPTDLTTEIVKYDSGGAAAVCAPVLYTAAPTITDAAAKIVNQAQVSSAVLTAAPISANSSSGIAGWAFGASDLASPLVIRPGEELVMNLAGAALPAGFTSIFQLVWMELDIPV